MDAKMELDRAEQRLRVTKARLTEVTAEHAEAADQARTLEADARRVEPDNTTLYARRTRDLTAAQAECRRCEELIARAQGEVDAAQVGLREPRATVWSSEVTALEASAREVAGAGDVAIARLAALFAARGELRAALSASSAIQRRVELLATDMAGQSKVGPSDEVALRLRRAQSLLWTIEKIRPEAIADPEYAAALTKELRAQLEPREHAGTEPGALPDHVAGSVSEAYSARTRVAPTTAHRDDA